MEPLRNGRAEATWARRWKVRIGIGCFLMAVAATIPWYELPDARRYRELVQVHETKAAECHRLERLARAAGRGAEAEILGRSARNFDWFAAAYRIRLAQNRLNLIEFLVHRR